MSKDALRKRIKERMNELNETYRAEKGINMANDNDAVTLNQLIRAVEARNTGKRGPVKFGEYWSTEAFARDLFGSARLASRTTPASTYSFGGYNMPVKDPNATLTVAELDRALRGLGYGAILANDVYNRVKINREPAWKTGDIVRSDSNNVFRKLSDGNWQHEGGSDRTVVLDSNISRPLTLIGRAV